MDAMVPMVSLSQLWLAIVLAAVAVFVASSIIHMVLKYHNADYRGLGNEDAPPHVPRRQDSSIQGRAP